MTDEEVIKARIRELLVIAFVQGAKWEATRMRMIEKISIKIWAVWMTARIVRKYGIHRGSRFVERWLWRERRITWRKTGKPWWEVEK